MSLQELETQLLQLDPAQKIHLIQVLTQSLASSPAPEPSIVDFFRNSPLCEVADELDLSRDSSPIPDRIIL
jgi:hypothetical protein